MRYVLIVAVAALVAVPGLAWAASGAGPEAAFQLAWEEESPAPTPAERGDHDDWAPGDEAAGEVAPAEVSGGEQARPADSEDEGYSEDYYEDEPPPDEERPESREDYF